MYDQESIALINHLLKSKLINNNPENSVLKASEFEEILEVLLDNLPPPTEGIISKWKWSLIERKRLFDYLQHINCEVIEDRILPFG